MDHVIRAQHRQPLKSPAALHNNLLPRHEGAVRPAESNSAFVIDTAACHSYSINSRRMCSSRGVKGVEVELVIVNDVFVVLWLLVLLIRFSVLREGRLYK